MGKTYNLSDQQLFALVKRDDIFAFKEIYNRYWAKLYSHAERRIRAREISEEIVQDVFTKLWMNRESIVIRISLSNYLISAVKYQVFNYFEKEYLKKRYVGEVVAYETAGVNTTEEFVFTRDLSSNIDRIIRDLPARCRSVFELSRKENKSNKEIADTLGISEKTVENQITRALHKIRLTLNNYISIIVMLF